MKLLVHLCLLLLTASLEAKVSNYVDKYQKILNGLEALKEAQEATERRINKTNEEVGKLLEQVRNGSCLNSRSNQDVCSATSGSPVCTPKSIATYTSLTGAQCATQAGKAGAALYRFRGGGCELLGKCSGFTPNSCCCQWKPLQPHSEYLLLRVRAYSNVMPYPLFIGSESSMCGDVKPGSNHAFKSPLLLMDPEIPFKTVRYEFLTGGERKAQITFKVGKGSLKKEGVWFSRKNYVDMFPWSKDSLKKYKYTDQELGMKGHVNAKLTRRFYLPSHDGCARDSGLMVALERKGACAWETSARGFPVFKYATNPWKPWSSDEFAEEMRLYGTVGNVDESLFMRTKKCAVC